MPHFRVISKATGEQVYEYRADQPIEWYGMEFVAYDHELVEQPPPEEDVPPPVYEGRRILTKLEFLRLFTMTERITMRAAAKESPVMEDYLQLMDLAQEVSLDDPDTVAGVQMMEQAGLLSAGRAVEVLRG